MIPVLGLDLGMEPVTQVRNAVIEMELLQALVPMGLVYAAYVG